MWSGDPMSACTLLAQRERVARHAHVYGAKYVFSVLLFCYYLLLVRLRMEKTVLLLLFVRWLVVYSELGSRPCIHSGHGLLAYYYSYWLFTQLHRSCAYEFRMFSTFVRWHCYAFIIVASPPLLLVAFLRYIRCHWWLWVWPAGNYRHQIISIVDSS